ncbi:DMT family transporter [Cellulomonas alba]|uniref:DMT family transporter n=1 Tax=Cellulomonas alba TaxID=3053467 RepID=A0ABT7SJC8_9CELL|nr:DMT family transporter [Cellulomonas alba]MDM7856261.1 DMT family transporter [Cellulomonas alba]
MDRVAEAPAAVATTARAEVAALAAAFVTGGLLATQSRVNGALGARLDDGVLAALVSFASGLLVATGALAASRRAPAGLRAGVRALRDGAAPWWLLLGGAAGAVNVVSQALVVALIGVALFTVGVVCGQTVTSLLVDRHGLGNLPGRPVTPRRAVAAAVAIGAVLLAALGDAAGTGSPWLLLVPCVAGAALGWQAAVTGQVRIVTASAASATWVNFAVGTLALTIATAVRLWSGGPPAQWPTAPWLYLGGLIGVAVVAAQAVIVRVTGVFLMGLVVLCGQVLFAVAEDRWWPVHGGQAWAVTASSAALVVGAVLIAAGRRPEVRTRGS